MTHPVADILSLVDAGQDVPAIAAALDVTPGRVYAVLREHRPDRPRKPRRRTSRLVPMIRGLAASGIQPARIAELTNCKRQYVYKVLGSAPRT